MTSVTVTDVVVGIVFVVVAGVYVCMILAGVFQTLYDTNDSHDRG